MSLNQDEYHANGSLPLPDTSRSVFESPEFKNHEKRVVDGEKLHKILGGFNDINGFDPKIFGFEAGNNMMNMLNLDFEAKTFEILKAHILRVMLLLAIHIQMQILGIFNVVNDIMELVTIILLSLSMEVQDKASYFMGNDFHGLRGKIARVYYSFILLPLICVRVAYHIGVCYSPTAISGIQEGLPSKEYIPESVTLLLKMNQYTVAPPPKLPQPWLDANKKIQVPSKKEVQNVLSIRNEFFTQRSTFMALEKLRISSEISRFVCWNLLIPGVERINVYEEFGYLWSDSCSAPVLEQLRVLETLIINELHSMKKDRAVSIRKIKLVCISGEVTLDMSFDDLDPVTAVLSSYDEDYTPENDQTLCVYLCDKLNRDLLGNQSNETIPQMTDLIVAADKKNSLSLQTRGYFAVDSYNNLKESVVYSTASRFGYNVYLKALFYYSKSLVKETETDRSSVTVSSQSVTSQGLAPGHYLVKFFQRILQLRPFDVNSSVVPMEDEGHSESNQ